ncbi:MAG: riboflavin biosynthesis protein RibF, partial [Candidatus Caenarcaniphilales bacterium]|nr:riboflavin biosynthesis protein RibF [Candidatus Caenarcaniphilales bacterium]
FTIHKLNDPKPGSEGRALALGMMDGVHLGHKELIKKAAIYAKENNLILCAMTFAEPPIRWTDPSKKIELITSLEERLWLFKSLGVEEALVFNFAEISKLQPDEYLQEVIKKLLNVKYVSCGENHRFGQKQKGNNELLKKWSEDNKVEVEIVSTIKTSEGKTVSSSLVREFLRAGNLKEASELLGHNYFIYQPLVSGRQIGTELGFPTLNFEYSIAELGRVQLPFGVYAAKVELKTKDGQDQKVLAAVNLGVAPTTNRSEGMPLVEAHLLGGNIEGLVMPSVGELVRVELLGFVRAEKKFESFEELKHQIAKDCKQIIGLNS